MTFYHWLLNRSSEDSPIGDLACEVSQEKTAKEIRFRSKRSSMRYLKSKGACEGALRALKEAWKQFERSSNE
jgi:hypothetical protein